MKKHLAWAAALALLLPGLALAAEFRAGDQPSVAQHERIQNDVYLAGSSVTSAGTVVGDVIAGGGTVVVSGEVSADVIAGGGTVTVLSTVGDDVRAGGGTLVVMGKIGGDAILGGGQITLGGPGVAGDVAVGGGTVRIDAPVMGSVKIGGGAVYINSQINGKVEVDADTLTLGRNAVINGDLIYKATKEVTEEPGALVKGKVNFTPRATNAEAFPVAAFAAIFSLWVIGKFLALLAASLVVGLMFRRYSNRVVEQATARPWFEMGRGLLAVAAIPVISALLCVTVVGIPLGILGFLSFAALMLFSWIVTPFIVGSVVYGYIAKQTEVSWKTILLGVIIYSVLGVIPVLGWLAQLLVSLIAIGSVVAIKQEVVRAWR
jgi:cytoskeletal protein CcmA (bactofilin family)